MSFPPNLTEDADVEWVAMDGLEDSPVRPPDAPRVDCLLPADRPTYRAGRGIAREPDPYDADPELRTALMESKQSMQDDLDRVLAESRLMYEMEMKVFAESRLMYEMEQKEKQLVEMERKARKEKLAPFLDKWVPLSRIDPEAKRVNVLLMPAVTAYLELQNDMVQLFAPEYETVFSFLKKTRCPIDCLTGVTIQM